MFEIDHFSIVIFDRSEMKNFFIFSFSRICLPLGNTQLLSFLPANAKVTKIEFENFEFCPKSIKIEFTTLPESASFDNVLYNPFIESNMIRWGSVEIFVRTFGRISVMVDSTVLNKLRLGIVNIWDFTYPEKRKSKSTNRTGRVCFFTIS